MVIQDQKIAVRLLTDSDVDQFTHVRLEALRDYPKSYGSVYDIERKYSVKQMTALMRALSMHGVFIGEELIAIGGVVTDSAPAPYLAPLNVGLYIKPNYRHSATKDKGIDILRLLIEQIKSHVKSLGKFDALHISYENGNIASENGYLRVGFRPFSKLERVFESGRKMITIEMRMEL